jgi:hypothetical protein
MFQSFKNIIQAHYTAYCEIKIHIQYFETLNGL